jgi:hypothetical protein
VCVPVLPNAEEPIFSATTVFLPTHAVMLYPRASEEKERRRWYAAAMAREYAICRQTGAPETILSGFHAWIPDLWALRQSPARVYEDGLARMKRASMSGHVLLHMLSLARYHPRHCKLERVNAVLSEFGRRAGRPVSESALEKLWPDFKSVAHLWASYSRRMPNDVPAWIDFLKVAEALRRAGEATRLLNPAETWKPEAHYLYRSDVSLEPLEPDKLALLDAQFPA